jgi:hypothetical protein
MLKTFFTLKCDGSLKEIAAPTNLSTTNTQVHHQFDRYNEPFKKFACYAKLNAHQSERGDYERVNLNG